MSQDECNACDGLDTGVPKLYKLYNNALQAKLEIIHNLRKFKSIQASVFNYYFSCMSHEMKPVHKTMYCLQVRANQASQT